MLRRRILMQKKTEPIEKWDYEWNYKDGKLPPKASWTGTPQILEDGILFSDFQLKFADICSEAVLFTRIKSVSGASPMSGILRYGQKDGAKWFIGMGGRQTNIRSNVTGKGLDTECNMYIMHDIEIRMKNQVFELFIDGSLVQRGQGVKNNNYLTYCGLEQKNGEKSVIAEIKWRGMQC